MTPSRIRLLLAAALLPLATHAQTIFIDFGTPGQTTPIESGWNNVTNVGVSANPISLIDSVTQQASGLSYAITDAFQATGSSAPASASGEFPATAVRDYFYGSDQNAPDQSGQITFYGFDPSQKYTFTFLASSSSAAGDLNNRATLFTLTGATTETATQNAAGNNLELISIIEISPSVSGTFTLDVSKHPELNTNSSGYFHLNALKIEVAQIPEPSSTAALAAGAAILAVALKRRRRALVVSR